MTITDAFENKNWPRKRAALAAEYESKSEQYQLLLSALIKQLTNSAISVVPRSQVMGRVKQFSEFYRKLLRRSQEEEITDPFEYITDLIGLRIVVPFIEDIAPLEKVIRRDYGVREVEHKSLTLAPGEFGYDATHILIEVPPELMDSSGNCAKLSIEIQLRTILQNAWAEVEHELVYKTSLDMVDDGIRRKLLALNATLTLADTILQEVRDFQNRRYDKLIEQNRKMMEKVSTIPESANRFDTDEHPAPSLKSSSEEQASDKSVYPNSLQHEDSAKTSSMNDLVIQALEAHLSSDLDRAVALYTDLLQVTPTPAIFNHRGLALFALSEYDRAIQDFSDALHLDSEDRRAYTNRGLALRMLQRHEEALADFDYSLKLNPMWPDTFYGRALTFYDIGNVSAAIEDCDQALALNPDFKQVQRFKKYLQRLDI